MRKGYLYLADGSFFEGAGFGREGTAAGELVFNTSITGYQEILTDPSYAGQIITLTYPLIGNYGTNEHDNESRQVYARGLIVREISEHPSNYMSENTIDAMMNRMGVIGICGVDTRSITRKVRDTGVMPCAISTEAKTKAELKAFMEASPALGCLMPQVSVSTPEHFPGSGPKVAVLDFGVKANIIESLKQRDCDITVFPYDTPLEKIDALHPDGVLLSNGPGDPKDVGPAIDTVRGVMQKYPTFGICLGHQILALAAGGDTYKMRFGHRGGNHGIYDIEQDKAYITAQNHGYAVRAATLEGKMKVTHVNLNDDSVEGIRHPTLPVFSVQFHPEGAPGPQDTDYLFDKFMNSMTKA